MIVHTHDGKWLSTRRQVIPSSIALFTLALKPVSNRFTFKPVSNRFTFKPV